MPRTMLYPLNGAFLTLNYDPIVTSTAGHSAKGTAIGFSRQTLTCHPRSFIGAGLSPILKSDNILFATCDARASSVSKEEASMVYTDYKHGFG